MARAKRTDRTEARRRYREEQALLDGEAGAEADTEAPAAPTRKRSTAKAEPKAAAKAAPPPRPSITAAFKGAVHPLDLRGDLRALPQVVTNWGFLAAMGLTVVAAAWFVLAYNEGMAAIPVGTATQEQMQAVVGSNSIPFFLGQMAFLSPPPAIGAFLIGFAAKRASWLGGLIYGIFVVLIVIVLLGTPAGRLLTVDSPEGNTSLIVGHAAWSPVGAALFAAAAAWYRRFLNLSNPNRARREEPRKPQGRGDMKPARR